MTISDGPWGGSIYSEGIMIVFCVPGSHRLIVGFAAII